MLELFNHHIIKYVAPTQEKDGDKMSNLIQKASNYYVIIRVA